MQPAMLRFMVLLLLAGVAGSSLAVAEESADRFFHPSAALPPAGRASLGVAERYAKGYLLHKSAGDEPSEAPAKHATHSPRPSTGPSAPGSHGEKHSANSPADQNAENDPSGNSMGSEEDESGDEAADDEPDEAERSTLLPADCHRIGGINWEVLYTGEVFNNTRGGLSTNGATRYRGNVDIVFTYDTEENGLWDGGQFFVYGSNTHGQTLTADFVGDFQFYSNIDSSPRPYLMQVSEYWYMQKLVDDIFSVKFGKCDANADFAYMQLAADFVNSSFSLSPNVYLPTWPNQALGAAAFWQPREKLQFSAGVYDGAGDGRLWGFTTLGDNGAFLIGQAMWTPRFGADEDHPGTYRLGIWEHTGDFEFVSDFDNEFVCQRGVYATLEQLICKEAGTDGQGLGIFSQISHADADNIFNTLDTHWSVGMIYRGWFENRDADIIGLGVTDLSFKAGTNANVATPVRTEEVAIEMFYKYQFNNWTTLQPDLQFIANPNGDGSAQDALVAGFRFQTAL